MLTRRDCHLHNGGRPFTLRFPSGRTDDLRQGHAVAFVRGRSNGQPRPGQAVTFLSGNGVVQRTPGAGGIDQTVVPRQITEAASSFLGTAASAGSLHVYAVSAYGVVVEHGGALGGGVALGQALEGVVHDVVGIGDLVHGVVAFEHAPAGAELLDAVVH